MGICFSTSNMWHCLEKNPTNIRCSTSQLSNLHTMMNSKHSQQKFWEHAKQIKKIPTKPYIQAVKVSLKSALLYCCLRNILVYPDPQRGDANSTWNPNIGCWVHWHCLDEPVLKAGLKPLLTDIIYKTYILQVPIHTQSFQHFTHTSRILNQALLVDLPKPFQAERLLRRMSEHWAWIPSLLLLLEPKPSRQPGTGRNASFPAQNFFLMCFMCVSFGLCLHLRVE